MAKKTILGVQVSNRAVNAGQVQKILSEFGCNIKTRLGLHQVDEKSCAISGVVILELFGKESEIQEMEKQLRAIEGIQVQKMVFEV